MTDAQPSRVDPAQLRWFSQTLHGQEADDETAAIGHAFRIGERWLLIPMGLPAEVTPMIGLAKLPFTKPWCRGLANFRGELVPVYDLSRFLAQQVTGTLLLVLGDRDCRACVCIDEITVIRAVADAHSSPLNPFVELPEDLACLGLELEGQTYLQLDLGGLLKMLARWASVLPAETR